MKSKLIKISDFSERTGLSIKALRLYEAHGILVPARSEENRYRLYNESQVEIAREILNLRTTGFSTREIKALLPFRAQAEGGLLVILQAQLKKTDQTLKSLTQQRVQILQMIKQVKRGAGASSTITGSFFAKRLVCREVSESIKNLTNKELLDKTRKVPNSEFIQMLAMVDEIAKDKLLSILSAKAKKLVKGDMAQLDKRYSRFWVG